MKKIALALACVLMSAAEVFAVSQSDFSAKITGIAVADNGAYASNKGIAYGMICLFDNLNDSTLESVDIRAGVFFSSNSKRTEWVVSSISVNVLFEGKDFYIVSFIDFYGRGNYISPQEFCFGKSQRLSRNTFTRDGYVFHGWATKASYYGGIVQYKDEEEITVESDMTLYAVWASPALSLASESVDWASGSITLRCEDADTSGAAHTYTLEILQREWRMGYDGKQCRSRSGRDITSDRQCLFVPARRHSSRSLSRHGRERAGVGRLCDAKSLRTVRGI